MTIKLSSHRKSKTPNIYKGIKEVAMRFFKLLSSCETFYQQEFK